jgi:hypothetical protein
LTGRCQADLQGALRLEILIVVLLVLWLIGFFGPARFPSLPKTGSLVHILIVIVVILVIVRLVS